MLSSPPGYIFQNGQIAITAFVKCMVQEATLPGQESLWDLSNLKMLGQAASPHLRNLSLQGKA